MRKGNVVATARPKEWEGMVATMLPTGLTVLASCSTQGCARQQQLVFQPAVAPELACARMKRKGWRLGKKPLCPDCQRRPLRAALEPLAADHIVHIEEGGIMGSTTTIDAPKPSPAAKSAKLAALDYLRDEFDAEHGRYRQGASDDTIAAVTGLSEAAVRELREEWFGELKEPPEVAQLRAVLSAAEAGAAQAVTTAKAALEQATAALEVARQAKANLEAVAAKHGWKA